MRLPDAPATGMSLKKRGQALIISIEKAAALYTRGG